MVNQPQPGEFWEANVDDEQVAGIIYKDYFGAPCLSYVSYVNDGSLRSVRITGDYITLHRRIPIPTDTQAIVDPDDNDTITNLVEGYDGDFYIEFVVDFTERVRDLVRRQTRPKGRYVVRKDTDASPWEVWDAERTELVAAYSPVRRDSEERARSHADYLNAGGDE